jgi:hypothetical protein
LIRVNGRVLISAEFRKVLNEWFKVWVTKLFEFVEVFYNASR